MFQNDSRIHDINNLGLFITYIAKDVVKKVDKLKKLAMDQ